MYTGSEPRWKPNKQWLFLSRRQTADAPSLHLSVLSATLLLSPLSVMLTQVVMNSPQVPPVAWSEASADFLTCFTALEEIASCALWREWPGLVENKPNTSRVLGAHGVWCDLQLCLLSIEKAMTLTSLGPWKSDPEPKLWSHLQG